jgi:hypothetical protein
MYEDKSNEDVVKDVDLSIPLTWMPAGCYLGGDGVLLTTKRVIQKGDVLGEYIIEDVDLSSP